MNQQFITVDTREPWPHPWAAYLPEGWHVERGTLETGDIALAALPEGAVVERKTPGDLVGCIGSGRERFERELRRGRYTGRMVVVVEGNLADVCVAGRCLHHNAIVGIIAAWTLRYCPFVGSVGQSELLRTSPSDFSPLRSVTSNDWPKQLHDCRTVA